MTARAADKIAAGLRDAIAIARGQSEPARLHAFAVRDVTGDQQRRPLQSQRPGRCTVEGGLR